MERILINDPETGFFSFFFFKKKKRFKEPERERERTDDESSILLVCVSVLQFLPNSTRCFRRSRKGKR